MDKKEVKKVWSRIFTIKKGDLIRFKYGKVVWKVYDVQIYSGFADDRVRSLFKLSRQKMDSKGNLTPISLSRAIWDWDLAFEEIIKVGVQK